MWQDWAILGCVFILDLVFLPTVLKKVKVPLLTSVTYTLVMLVMTFILSSMGLWLATIGQGIGAIEWARMVDIGRRKD